MTTELQTVVNGVLNHYTEAENKPRVPCTRCTTGLCLDLPWIDKPICDECWDKIEAQGKSQSEAEEYTTRRKLSGLPSGFWKARFADYKNVTGPYKQHQQQVAKDVFMSLRASGNQSSGTLVQGPPGTGKTHLLACIANFLLQFQPVVWLDLQQLQFELGRSVFSKDKDPVEPYGKRLIRDTNVVIIDDFSFDQKPYDWLAGQIRGFFNDLVAQGTDIKLYLSTNNKLNEALKDPVTGKIARDQDLPSLRELFGNATLSRLKQLTTPTPFIGPDRRLG